MLHNTSFRTPRAHTRPIVLWRTESQPPHVLFPNEYDEASPPEPIVLRISDEHGGCEHYVALMPGDQEVSGQQARAEAEPLSAADWPPLAAARDSQPRRRWRRGVLRSAPDVVVVEASRFLWQEKAKTTGRATQGGEGRAGLEKQLFVRVCERRQDFE